MITSVSITTLLQSWLSMLLLAADYELVTVLVLSWRAT